MNDTPSRELFVTDISFDAGEEDLRKLFAVCGTVRSIHLLIDKNSGQFKGSAFVSMSSAAEAKDAINMLDGALLINRCITVKAARPKKPPLSSGQGVADSPRPRRRFRK